MSFQDRPHKKGPRERLITFKAEHVYIDVLVIGGGVACAVVAIWAAKKAPRVDIVKKGMICKKTRAIHQSSGGGEGLYGRGSREDKGADFLWP